MDGRGNNLNATRTSESGWKQLLGGLATGLVAVATVLSAILISSQEASYLAPTAIAAASPSAIATLPPATWTPASSPASVTPAPVTAQASPTLVASATPAPTIACPTPFGWSAHAVRSGETLASIANTYGTNPFVLIQGNCLVNTDLNAGQMLYVPPLPTRSPGPTPTRIPCGPPIHWVIYRVQPGDTLYGLSIRYGTSVYALAQANCMTSYTLRAGQPLYVPPVVVIPPTWTATRVLPSATPTATPSIPPSPTPTTPVSVTPSRTPAPGTATPSTATATPSPSATGPIVTPSTATPSVTHTPLPPTVTTEPSATIPATLPPTASATLPPTATATPVPPSSTPKAQPASVTPPPPTANPNPSATP